MSTVALAIESEQNPPSADQSALDMVILDQAALLRAQITASSAAATSQSSTSSGGRVGRAITSVYRYLRSWIQGG